MRDLLCHDEGGGECRVDRMAVVARQQLAAAVRRLRCHLWAPNAHAAESAAAPPGESGGGGLGFRREGGSKGALSLQGAACVPKKTRWVREGWCVRGGACVRVVPAARMRRPSRARAPPPAPSRALGSPRSRRSPPRRCRTPAPRHGCPQRNLRQGRVSAQCAGRWDFSG